MGFDGRHGAGGGVGGELCIFCVLGGYVQKYSLILGPFKMCFVRGATYCEEEQNTRNSPPRRSFDPSSFSNRDFSIQ